MIIKGHSRKDGRALAAYLLKETDEQKVRVLDHRGTVMTDLHSMLHSWEKEALAVTNGEKPIYHVQLRLAPGETLEKRQWFRTLEVVEKKLKLFHHPRAVVAHILNGEVHLHVAYSRLDSERGILLNMSHDRKHHFSTCREMEKEFGLRELDSKPRYERNGNQKTRSIEHKMAKESGTTRQALCAMVKDAWDSSNTGREFQAHLARHGITMTPGDQRDYNLWHNGKRYDPVRLIETVRTPEFRAKMQIDPPQFAETRTLLEARAGSKATRRKAMHVTHVQLNPEVANSNSAHVPVRTLTANPIRRKAADLLAFGPVNNNAVPARFANAEYQNMGSAVGAPF